MVYKHAESHICKGSLSYKYNPLFQFLIYYTNYDLWWILGHANKAEAELCHEPHYGIRSGLSDKPAVPVGGGGATPSLIFYQKGPIYHEMSQYLRSPMGWSSTLRGEEYWTFDQRST